MLEDSWVAEQLLASEDGLSLMELVSSLFFFNVLIPVGL
jgi:hypothetical protein